MQVRGELQTMLEAVRATRGMSNEVLMGSFLPLVEEALGENAMAKRESHVQGVLTLEEAMEVTGRSNNFFTHRSDSRGGRSRLDAWVEEGVARKAGRTWIIEQAAVERSGAEDPVSGTLQGLRDRPELTGREVAARMRASMAQGRGPRDLDGAL